MSQFSIKIMQACEWLAENIYTRLPKWALGIFILTLSAISVAMTAWVGSWILELFGAHPGFWRSLFTGYIVSCLPAAIWLLVWHLKWKFSQID